MEHLLKKLRKRRKKILYERLTEPLHLNIASVFVALFGSFKSKVEFDLVIRQQNAFSLYKAAEFAQWTGLKSITAIEFGVASGDGLLNICRIAEKVTQETGVHFNIFGFDTPTGMPAPRDYRDLPALFQEGCFDPVDREKLLMLLPDNAKLIVGNIEETIPKFLETISEESPIGFVSIDVDYYWSAKICLNVLLDKPEKYLPVSLVYLDDISASLSNPWVGELLAVNEFNIENENRKISPYTFLRSKRIFKQTQWIDRIFVLHVLDHEWRSVETKSKSPFNPKNPFNAQW